MPDIFTNSKNHSPSPPRPTRPFLTPIGMFSSFCQSPSGVWYKNHDEHEEVLLFLRATFITNFLWIITAVFFAALPIIISFALQVLQVEILFLPVLFRHSLPIIIPFYYLLLFSYILVNFITWFYNIALVTNEKIVDIDFSDLVYHDVAETKLSLVEDVKYIQSGFIASLLNFGDIFVQTAGKQENIEALNVPSPAKAVTIIGELIGKGPETNA